jgi:YHS domain-containing protein
MKESSTGINMEKSSETASLQIWNKVCPIKGEEIDADAPTVEYKGKVIGFCCPGCDAKFQKDPEKYLKNLNEDGTKFIGNS